MAETNDGNGLFVEEDREHGEWREVDGERRLKWSSIVSPYRGHENGWLYTQGSGGTHSLLATGFRTDRNHQIDETCPFSQKDILTFGDTLPEGAYICGGYLVSGTAQNRWCSDIDIFIVGNNPEAIAQQLWANLKKRAGEKSAEAIWVYRTDFAITIHIDNWPPLQIVLMRNRSLRDVLSSFDLDCCAVATNGTTLYALERALISLRTRVIPFRPEYITSSTDYRMWKYADRGFTIAIPRSLLASWDLVDRTFYTAREGLGKIEKGPYRYNDATVSRSVYSASPGIKSFSHLVRLANWASRREKPHRIVFGRKLSDVLEGKQFPSTSSLVGTFEEEKQIGVGGQIVGRKEIIQAIEWIQKSISDKPLAPAFSLSGKGMKDLGASNMTEFQKKNWFCKRGGIAPVPREKISERWRRITVSGKCGFSTRFTDSSGLFLLSIDGPDDETIELAKKASAILAEDAKEEAKKEEEKEKAKEEEKKEEHGISSSSSSADSISPSSSSSQLVPLEKTKSGR